MSVVVALKHDGVIYMGCDSQVSDSRSKYTLSNPNNYKIWKLKGFEDYCIFGGVGSLRDINIMRVSGDLVDELAILKDNVNFEYVVEKLVSNIFGLLDRYSRLKKSDDEFKLMSSSYVFSYKSSLFEIAFDGSVLEVDEYTAIGSGSDIALGSLNTTYSLEPIERIILAIESSCKTNLYVNYPIVITNSKSKELILIDSERKRFK
jgi:ATP-dependent protease HslVU (ClpYQ) peptidase subunit